MAEATLAAGAVATIRRMKLLASLVLPTLLPLAAHAQVDATGDYLSRMDSNGDGGISPAEYQDWMSYGFDAMDRNRDGVLAPDELPGGKGKPVTRAEYRARIAATFNKQDVNRDGSLSARELAAPPQ
jgi:hypothetical protein